MFFKKKKVKQDIVQDLSITYDIESNSYIITSYNANRKVRVLKHNKKELVLDTCYKHRGRPKKGVQ